MVISDGNIQWRPNQLIKGFIRPQVIRRSRSGEEIPSPEELAPIADAWVKKKHRGQVKVALKDYDNRRKNFAPSFTFTDAVQVREGILDAVENTFKANKQKIAAVAYKELTRVEKAIGAPIDNKLGIAKAITNYVVEGFEKSTRVSAAPIHTTVSASSINAIVRSMVKWERVPLRAVVASARIVTARYLGSKQHKSS